MMQEHSVTNWNSNQYRKNFVSTVLNTKKELALSDRFFIRYSDKYDNNTVIFSNNGALFFPKCTSIKSIEVPNQIEECFNDLQIRVLFSNNTKVNAFLTSHNNIIRKQSTFINCSNDKYYELTGIWSLEEIN